MGKLNQTDKSLNTLRVSTLSPNNNLNSTTMRRTRALKNTAARGGKMLKMDDNVYAMRRKVMDELYNIKRRGYRIPRIEVRIVRPSLFIFDLHKLSYLCYISKNE